MKSFEFIQKTFHFFRIRPINDDASPGEKIFDVICFGAIALNFAMVSISSIVLMYQQLDNFSECLKISLSIIGVPAIFYALIHSYSRRDQIAEIFLMFQQIYDESK